MNKKVIILSCILLMQIQSFAENSWRAGVRQNLVYATSDTSRALALAAMCETYIFDKPDSALYYGYNALSLAKKIHFQKGEVSVLVKLALAEITLGNYSKALQLFMELGRIAEKNNLSIEKANSVWGMGWYYYKTGEFEYALRYLDESIILYDSLKQIQSHAIGLYCIAETFLAIDQLDSALFYGRKAYDKSIEIENNWTTYYSLLGLGKVLGKAGDIDLALTFLRQSLTGTWLSENVSASNLAIAGVYHQSGLQDSAVFYAKKAMAIAQENGLYMYIIEANLILTDIYESFDYQQALFYSKNAFAVKDSINRIVQQVTQQTFYEFDEQERKRELEEAKTQFQYRLRMNAFLGISFTLLIIALMFYRNSRLKQKAKQKIETAYNQLKSTQSQLIQSEKMASLGELTAGIAHEIQNPLNFVNNFSEISNELIVEIEEERAKNPESRDEILVSEVLSDIKQNLEKINHHGKRAADIVKGMLQHSRTSSGIKEPTDINALADEYLRLAYHGLRAKDKSFNADFKTDFDPNLPKINVIPQDISRVLLNLINNAFYAVDNRAKLLTPPPPEGGMKNDQIKFVPTVTISTSSLPPPSGGRGVRITVKDNGDGIPPHIIDKIFQPFFTTKPTGQGTGLGLSLSYDIVKAHGGELKVETKEGEGSEFIIQLPIT